jgi:hypothetical protein
MPSLEKIAVPVQDRVRTYQQQEIPQFLPRQMVEQACEDHAVGVGERGLADLALQHQQLMPQRQDLEVFVPITHRQQAQ